LTRLSFYPQLPDLLTTLVGFRPGAAEASPSIRVLMHAGPAAGAVASEILAWALAVCVAGPSDPVDLLLVRRLIAGNLMVMLAAPGRPAMDSNPALDDRPVTIPAGVALN
jgi:hypothetical protein